MNFVGYLVTMANLQNLGSGPLRDMSVRVADVGTLAIEFKAMPQFNAENFTETGFYRVADIGMYMSRNIINYLTKGNGNPKAEGLMIIFYYDKAPEQPDSTGLDDGTVAYINSDDYNGGVKQYLDSQNNFDRSKRSIEQTSTDNINGVNLSKFNEKFESFMKAHKIFGFNQGTTSDIPNKAELDRLRVELAEENKLMHTHMNMVFKEAANFEKDIKRVAFLMNKAAIAKPGN